MSLRPDLTAAISPIVLKRAMHRTSVRIPRELLRCRVIEEGPSALDPLADDLVVMLEASLYRRKDCEVVEFWVPQDWWQHAKQRFAPAWALARWPVLLRRLAREVWAEQIFPDFAPRGLPPLARICSRFPR